MSQTVLSEHIAQSLKLPFSIVESYLSDLTDEELLVRPLPAMNHIAWQWGHLIASEKWHLEQISSRPMPSLPQSFVEYHSKENAHSDNPEDFCTAEQYRHRMRQQRNATLELLGSLSDDELQQESPESIRYLGPTVGTIFTGEATHWMMHAGQWVAVRRQLGKAPLY